MANQKLFLIAVLLIVIAYASAYRTIITTVEIDEPPSETQSCTQEVERKDLSSCEEFIGQSRRSPFLALRGIENPEERVPRQCCNQLKQLRDDCQCEGIRSAVKKQLEQGQVGREEYKQAVRRANDISSSCGLRQHCQIQEPSY